MKSVQEIYEAMRSAFQQRSGMEIGDSCDLAVRLYAAAAEIQALYCQAEWVLKQCFPHTAQGQALDDHGAMRNISRRGSAKSSGCITFSVSSAAAAERRVPAGTVCLTAEGIRFVTLSDAAIKAGELSCTVMAEAIESGEAGNVSEGSINRMSIPPVGVESCRNDMAFTGGADAETDAELRLRVMESFHRLPNGANAAYYELQAENHDGVRAAKTVGRARGIGTVDVYIAAQSGLPSEQLLQEVYDDLNAKREIAVDLQVKAPAAKTVDIAAKLVLKSGYRLEDVQAEAQQALRAFFSANLLGRGVKRADICDLLYHTEGVENYVLSAPAADLEAEATALPVLGAVSLQEG